MRRYQSRAAGCSSVTDIGDERIEAKAAIFDNLVFTRFIWSVVQGFVLEGNISPGIGCRGRILDRGKIDSAGREVIIVGVAARTVAHHDVAGAGINAVTKIIPHKITFNAADRAAAGNE